MLKSKIIIYLFISVFLLLLSSFSDVFYAQNDSSIPLNFDDKSEGNNDQGFKLPEENIGQIPIDVPDENELPIVDLEQIIDTTRDISPPVIKPPARQEIVPEAKPVVVPRKIIESDVQILKLVQAFDEIDTIRRQWAEVYVKNSSLKKQTVTVHLQVTYPNGRNLRVGDKRVELLPKSVKNVIFNFNVPQNFGGIYRIDSIIFDKRRDELAIAPQVLEFFATGPSTPLDFIDRDQAPVNKPSITKFEGVSVSELKFLSKYSLPQSYVPVELAITNNGANMALDYTLDVYLVREENAFAPIGEAVFREENIDLTAGENKIRKFNALIPTGIESGNLLLLAQLEPKNTGRLSIERLNLQNSKIPLTITKIVPESPADGSNLFVTKPVLFSWSSQNLNNFYLEFSVKEQFDNPDLVSRFPDRFTINDEEITSNKFESMIVYLLQQDSTNNTIYWRILAVDDIGFIVAISPVQKIIYHLN